jgi:uncharacterized membrane protein YdjX (TVP38/TMEM64 family)
MHEELAGERRRKEAGMPDALKRYLPLALLAVAMLVAWQTGLHRYLSLEALVEHRAALDTLVAENLVLALAAFALVYVVTVALSLPGASFLTIAGGLLFGWLVGGTVTVLAATIGATLIFLIASTSLGETLRARAGPSLDRLAKGFEEDAFHYLLFLRLVPVFPFWLVNLAPAFLGVPLRTYVVATLVGIVPGTFAFAVVGAGLGSVVDAQEAAYRDCLAADPSGGTCSLSLDPGSLITPGLLAAFAALGVVALIPVAVRKLRGRRQTG